MSKREEYFDTFLECVEGGDMRRRTAAQRFKATVSGRLNTPA